MFRTIMRILARKPDPVAAAAQARVIALAEYRAAKDRRDSRRVHAAAKALREATTAAVRAELRR